MEDKFKDIDLLLSAKFENFEAEPDLNAGVKLFHSLHPVDLALSVLLDKNENAAPDSGFDGILKELNHSSHPIDITLHKHLKDLEATPLRPLAIPVGSVNTGTQYKKWLILPLLLSIISVIYFLYQTKSMNAFDSMHSDKPVTKQADQVNKNKIEDAISPETGEDEPLSKDINYGSNSVNSGMGQSKNKENHNSDKHIVSENKRYPKSIDLNPFHTVSESNSAEKNSMPDLTYFETESISDKNYLSISKPVILKFSDEFESLSLIEYLTIKYPQKGRISPIGIGLGIGFLNETGFGSEAGTDKLHKDFINNYENSSNAPRRGIQISLLSDISTFRRIRFRTGAVYSYSSTNKKFDYVFDNIPIYNPDGSIKGYFTRPQQNSPQVHQTINTSSRSLNIPVHVLYMLHGKKKFSIWTGAGIQTNLFHFKTSKVFSFSKEELVDLEKTGISRFQGNFSFQLHYKLSASWSLQFIAESTYRKEYAETEGIQLKGKSIVPAFNIGLMYNPILKNK